MEFIELNSAPRRNFTTFHGKEILPVLLVIWYNHHIDATPQRKALVKMSNFEFLRKDYPALADFGGLAERYYKSDPNSCLMKLGMMSETIVRLIYQIDGIEPPATDEADQRIIKLHRENYITDDLESLFHILRRRAWKACFWHRHKRQYEKITAFRVIGTPFLREG